ncbi:TPA: hypothetical protein N0F65_000721 [Lagenidium giganteum]|uniref:SWIM-type domain-containing protein n=1 Tax=Lagenidium giganteum TaxID=4803 RepID=A0AAV2ZDD3_9STRA|nr:TPA: hypothetical protein N0F65_000721 [Lagenidium giganteum]
MAAASASSVATATAMLPPPELVRGMRFADPKEAVYAVQDLALAQHKSVRVARSSGADRRLECRGANCGFFVQIYRKKGGATRFWYVSSLQLEHSGTCDAKLKPTQRQIERLASVSAALTAKPDVAVGDLIDQVADLHSFALNSSRRTLYRAKAALKKKALTQLVEAHTKIPPFLEQFMEQNPQAFARHEYDSFQAFQRAIMIPHHAGGLQKVYGLAVELSTSPDFAGGAQLVLLGKDGNMDSVVVAVAAVATNNTEAYDWFFSMLAAAGVDMRGVPLFCDCNTNLLAVAERHALNLKLCGDKIVQGLQERFKAFNEYQRHLVWELQASESAEVYKTVLVRIEADCGQQVAAYLQSLPPRSWCVFANASERLYGWQTSTFDAETFKRAVGSDIRVLSPLQFLESMCCLFVDAAYRRSENARQWSEQGLVLTPSAQNQLDHERAKVDDYTVQHASREISYVYRTGVSPRVMRRVNLATKSCTCVYYFQTGIPCRHLVAALQSHERLAELHTFFEPCYLVDTYATAFGDKVVLMPIATEISEPAASSAPQNAIAAEPLRLLVNASRTSAKRPRSEPRVPGQTFKKSKCTLCLDAGHNRRTCPLSIRPEIVFQKTNATVDEPTPCPLEQATVDVESSPANTGDSMVV